METISVARLQRFFEKLTPIFFWVGLASILAYWLSVEPAGRGYVEDFCGDISRRVMAENLKLFGRPVFKTDLYMAPGGMSVPFFSWSIERDWLGAYVWMWNKDFPFVWAYFLVSLIGSYVGVGFILKKMGFGKAGAWLFAALVVVAHIPRHFKLWHHFEYVAQHWVYWTVFLDAWIWSRYFREKRWDLNLELWRGVCMVGVLGTPGYLWGPMILEWGVLRIAMIAAVLVPLLRKKPLGWRISFESKRATFPVIVGLAFSAITLIWFLPLVKEMSLLGEIPQPLGWFAQIKDVIFPLWLPPLLGPLGWSSILPRPFFRAETVVTIGWFLWVPAIAGAFLLVRKNGWRGFALVLPYLFLIFVALVYSASSSRNFFHDLVQSSVPFMKFFRNANRWGIFLPYFVAPMIVLAWPELRSWFTSLGRQKWALLVVFTIFSGVEISWLMFPTKDLPSLHRSTVKLLEQVKQAPGSAVLDMPFCVAGGNGVCTREQCPNYPSSTIGACFSTWHEKKVYGLYQSRLVFAQCEIYDRAPYVSWFDAWAKQRCLTPPEWDEFCAYLDEHPELSAVMVYPGIWTAVAKPECRAEFNRRLGPPIGSGVFYSEPTVGARGRGPMSVLRFGAKCSRN